MVEIPLGLRQALESGDCVLFVGAGVGCHLKIGGVSLPDAPTLASDLAVEFKIEAGGSTDLAKLSEIVEIRTGRAELETYVKKRICNPEPDEILRWISTLRWKAIFTTNYDNGVEQAYAKTAIPRQTPVPIASTSEVKDFDRRYQVPLYYLHGRLCGSEKSHLIITESDYAEFRKQRQMMFEILKREFATSTFLYIGYSNQDPNWKMVREELRSEFHPAEVPAAYRVAHETSPLDIKILKNKNIETIIATFEDFQKSAVLALAGSQFPDDALKRIQSSVPTELWSAFDRNAAAVARLLSSWEYVNQAPFAELPNTHQFFRGDRANWGLISRRIPFERDVEKEVYDALLDYATSPAKTPSIVVILAPAGYGITTFLRTLAAKLCDDRAGGVFIHREGTRLLQGDIEFAESLFPGKCPFFLIDNAADFENSIYSSFQRLRDLGKPAMFIIGERLNEWRYARRSKAPGKEFIIEPLSDPEINRLLRRLEDYNELNALAHLSPNLRFAAIKQNDKGELLVTLREATEGKAFDAILEDEYRSMPDDLAKELYLVVACFYQHGALIRDSLVADLLKKPILDIYKAVNDASEGVVLFEEIDPAFGHYAARARHRKIAAVVWERCALPTQRERIIMEALSLLNLNYRVDVKAFDDFVRSDRLVDSIGTLEGRTQFFEQACQKDPTSPYVRQHYARMLARANKFTLALNQIEDALKINPDIRVLHHTKGVILSDLSKSTKSKDMARRFLIQSEHEFRLCLSMNNRDEYAYQTLASLYVDWACRCVDPVEATDYLSKAESVISDGLRNARVRADLWLVSARIQEILGNEPEYLKALERAATVTPASIVSKYLLGRAYRKAGDPENAVKILLPLVEANPDEFRACVELARSMYDLGEPFSKCIAVLKLSTLYGLSDPRFVGTLGGMLFMDGKFSEAQETFSEFHKHEFPAQEQSKIQFKPRDTSNPKLAFRLTGQVEAVQIGYAFISVEGFPNFFCHGSKFGQLVIRPGLMLEFEPAFTARGAIADNILECKSHDFPTRG